MSPRDDLLATLKLWRLVRGGRYSVIHTHSAKGGVVGRVAAFAARTPTLYTPHAWSFLVSKTPFQSRFYRAVEQVLALVSSRIVCVSTEELELGLHSLKRSEKILRLVPNGITPPPTVRERSRAGEVVVGTVARLARQKGIDYLIEAAAEVCAKHGDVRFVVAGDGPDAQALRDQVASQGLEGRFEFVGPVEEPWEVLGRMDVFVLPSRWEGMPYTLLEAMGSGLPVVATDVGGVRDLIVDDRHGTVVAPADPGALAEAISRYVSSPSLRATVGELARTRVLEEFSQERMLERTLAVYSEALA